MTSSADHDEVLAAVLRDPGDWSISVAKAGAIARGMGHSYGDAAMRRDGLVLDMTSLPGHEFDPEAGLVSAWAGETLRDLLRALVPRGWILPVVPGTQHVTVGGAIAATCTARITSGRDPSPVTSPHWACCSPAVRWISCDRKRGWLVRSDGWGMGLTGVILRANLALQPVVGIGLSIDVESVGDLDEAFGALLRGDAEHRVVWLDLLGPRAGRGVATGAGHVAGADRPAAKRARFAVPLVSLGALLRPSVVRAFNACRFAMAPRLAQDRPVQFAAEMFPGRCGRLVAAALRARRPDSVSAGAARGRRGGHRAGDRPRPGTPAPCFSPCSSASAGRARAALVSHRGMDLGDGHAAGGP